LVQAHEDTLRLADAALRHHRLSATARQALASLDGAGGSLSQTEIAERLLTKPSSITSLIDTLERRALVLRQRDAHDRRRQLVTITAAGARAVRQFVPETVAIQTAVMTGLNERERGQLTRMLATISKTAAAVDGDAIVAATGYRGESPMPVVDGVAGRNRPK
jgi:DNA-binding MarR family transcriptional regulator